MCKEHQVPLFISQTAIAERAKCPSLSNCICREHQVPFYLSNCMCRECQVPFLHIKLHVQSAPSDQLCQTAFAESTKCLFLHIKLHMQRLPSAFTTCQNQRATGAFFSSNCMQRRGNEQGGNGGARWSAKCLAICILIAELTWPAGPVAASNTPPCSDLACINVATGVCNMHSVCKCRQRADCRY